MSQLIPFEKRVVGNDTIETVDGRDLHAFLEIGKDYTNWAKAQIKRAELIENENFVLFAQKGEKGNKPTQEYFFTLDSCYHISMMSHTAKGKEARKYFITCKRELESLQNNLLSRHPELAAIQHSLLAIAEAKEAARIADEKAEKATALALKALEAQQWVTLRQYRFLHNLEHQLSDKILKEFSTHLIGYCTQKNIPIDAGLVADRMWGKENRYHSQTITEVLPGWLSRYYGQEDFLQ